jgi:hypothetical protein
MTCLDLFITSDTAVAHLAGALGVPVWKAVSTTPDWRWLSKREDNPWYPTMRIFRQHKFMDWTPVFDRIAIELRKLVPTTVPTRSVAIEIELRSVNAALWDIEDQIRDCEREGDFGPKFVELARSVYINNDHRAVLNPIIFLKPAE